MRGECDRIREEPPPGKGLRGGGLALRKRTRGEEGRVALLLEEPPAESEWWTILWEGDVKLEHVSYLEPILP